MRQQSVHQQISTILKKGTCTELFSYLFYSFYNFSRRFLSREGSAAFIGAHLTFINACKLCEFADIQEVEIVEERRDIVFEHNLRILWNSCSFFFCFFHRFTDAILEILFGRLYVVAETAKTITSDLFF